MGTWRRVSSPQEASIYHVELATHDVLIANRAAAESYRDDGNRCLLTHRPAQWGAAALRVFCVFSGSIFLPFAQTPPYKPGKL